MTSYRRLSPKELAQRKAAAKVSARKRRGQRGSLHRPLTEQEKYEATERRKKKLRNPLRWK